MELQGTELVQSSGRAAAEELQVVSFRVGEEDFAIDILRVQEIIRHQRLTRVPNSPSFVNGVINLRGKVIPVIALCKRFGVSPRVGDIQSRIVVLRVLGATVGFIVDSVPEVLRIHATTIAEPPRLDGSHGEYVSGVARVDERLVILLDVDRVLGPPAKEAHAGAATF